MGANASWCMMSTSTLPAHARDELGQFALDLLSQ
jgi:hypothetical protein